MSGPQGATAPPRERTAERDAEHSAERAGERGAVIPIVGLCMTMLILFAAFAVDLGRISLMRRDLQLVADDVALDMSRRLDGSTADQLTASPSFWADFDASRARNGFPSGGSRVLTLTLGCYTQTTDTFTPAATAVTPSLTCPIPTSVRVLAGNVVDYAFRWGTATTSRAGIAAKEDLATFSLGSLLARVNFNDATLLNALLSGRVPGTGLLGGSVNLLSYSGLVDANVTLDQLRVAGGFGTIDELLEADMTLAEFNVLAADALTANGDTANAAVFDLFAVQSTHAVDFRLGDVLDVDSPSTHSGLSTAVNLFELMAAGAQAVNANTVPPSFLTGSLATPCLTPGVLGVTTTACTDVSYRVVSPPVIRYNARVGAVAETAQLELNVTTTFGVSISVLGLGLLSGTVRVPITVGAAGAKALLTAIRCPASGNVIDILDTLSGASARINAPSTSPLVNLTAPLVNVSVFTVGDNTEIFPSSGSHFLGDIAIGETREDTNGNVLDFGDVLEVGNVSATGTVGILSLPLSGLLSLAVRNTLVPVINNVLVAMQPTLTELFRALGVSAPSADVSNIDTICGGPFLAG